jgi:hypothetical protein
MLRWLYIAAQEELADIIRVFFHFFHLKGGGRTFLRCLGTYVTRLLDVTSKKPIIHKHSHEDKSIQIMKLIHLLAFDGSSPVLLA